MNRRGFLRLLPSSPASLLAPAKSTEAVLAERFAPLAVARPVMGRDVLQLVAQIAKRVGIEVGPRLPDPRSRS